MRKTLAILMLLPLAPVAAAVAATFERLAIAPDQGIDGFDRSVARTTLRRDLFGAVGSSLALTRTDIYDRFPFTESRTWQVVTDPAWNRVLAGDTRSGFAAWSGEGTALGPLSEPRGVALGSADRLYVCDSGHQRIVVLRLASEFDALQLVPEGVIEGFSRPWAVAWSDAGTPEDAADDRLYVTEAGRNGVALVTLGATPRVAARLGGLGGGVGRFAGPLAVAVGRHDGRATADVYVADAHNRRIVHLRDRGDRLEWVEEARTPFSQVSALDCDAAGNLYVTGPRDGSVAKLSPRLEALATLSTATTAAPRDFHIVQAVVHDHRDGTVSRRDAARGVLLQDWSDDRGVTLWRLGLEARDAALDREQRLGVLLTDRADVRIERVDTATRAVSATHEYGVRPAGRQSFDLAGDGLLTGAAGGAWLVRLTARPPAGGGEASIVELALNVAGTPGDPDALRPRLLGNSPNPFAGATVIRVWLPAGGGVASPAGAAPATARVEIFDTTGRLTRAFEQSTAGAGALELPWDGRDAAGRGVPSGVYFYRVRLSGATLNGQLVVVR